MNRIIISKNDSPAFVLPEGWHEGNARELCEKLQKEDQYNVARRDSGIPGVAVHYHWEVVPEYQP